MAFQTTAFQVDAFQTGNVAAPPPAVVTFVPIAEALPVLTGGARLSKIGLANEVVLPTGFAAIRTNFFPSWHPQPDVAPLRGRAKPQPDPKASRD